ncbi:MAG: ABC transporter ATP-binding protein, partial [Promethearchaeota archaeon]
MRSLEEDMFTEDIYEEANFTDAQFEEMLEWIKKRRFYVISILIEAKDIETDKDVIIEGSVLKSFEYSLYPRTMVVLVENVIMAEEKVDIPYFIVIEKSRFELYRNRISRKPRKGTITKNIQLVVEGIQEIRGFLEETGKESRKVKEKLLIKNYKLRNDFKNDTGNEVVILKRDYSKKFSHISNLARTHDVKAILEGTYYFFDKQVDAVVKGTILHLDESPEKLQLKLVTILQKDRDIIKLFLEKGDFIEILDEIKQKGFYPDILFLQMNKEKKRHKNVIKVKNLTISFGKRTIIDKASFDIQRGSIVGIIGESGAGKSTTVKAILGELKYQGKITIMGIDAKKTKQIAPFMGYVPQDLSLMYHDFSPMENMIHFGRQYGLDEKVIARKAKDLLEDLQIPEYISKPLGSLSGGQKRRVSVAIAMIHDPDILILDEPTSGLDPMTRFELWKFFDKINKMYGITLIVISHYLDEIE